MGPSVVFIPVFSIKLTVGQWLWLNWQSGCVRQQRSEVRIQSLVNFYIENIYCQLYLKDDNKAKEARNGRVDSKLMFN